MQTSNGDIRRVIVVKDFSEWHEYEGASEGSGRSEKIWLEDDDGNVGLFKYPKSDPLTGRETTEHISEHLAHQIGDVLDVATADVDIGMRNGRIGSMSYQINKSNELILEGINFVSRSFPNYDADKMVDVSTGKHYSIEHIFYSTKDWCNKDAWIKMMLFDFLIGNADRHQSNWAILIAPIIYEGKPAFRVKRCPLYDNGSSLCCYVHDEQLNGLLGKDKRQFDSLVDSKSRSIIRIDGSSKQKPKHSDVVRYLLKTYPKTTYGIGTRFLNKLNDNIVDKLMDQYQPNILVSRKNELIRKFLKRKLEILNKLILGEN